MEAVFLANVGSKDMTKQLLAYRRRRIKLLEEEAHVVVKTHDAHVAESRSMKEEINNLRIKRAAADRTFVERREALDLMKSKLAYALEQANVIAREREQLEDELQRIQAQEEANEKRFQHELREAELDVKRAKVEADRALKRDRKEKAQRKRGGIPG